MTKAPFSYEILTNSMVPALNPGDKVISGNKEPNDIKIGDIVIINPEYFLKSALDVFFHPILKKGYPVIHRVIDKKKNEGNYFFKTKGDNGWRVDAASRVIEKNDEYIIYDYDETNAFIPESEIIGVVLKIIKKPKVSVSCPSCGNSIEYKAFKKNNEKNQEFEALLEYGKRYEVKIYREN